MKKTITLLLFMMTLLTDGQQLYVEPDAILYISPGANLEIGGNLENDGTILNTGALSLYGDWTINNIFNGIQGDLFFLGGQDQMVSPPSLLVNSMVLNQGGEVSFSGDQFTVTNDITFLNGVVKTTGDSKFVLESNVRVVGGSTSSYFQGKLSYQGSGIRKFPMGYEGVYAPITMLDVFGSNPEITVSYQIPNPEVPEPDEELLGVSGNGIWEVELTQGTINGTPVQIDFSGEDLENFSVRNNIRHRVNSPVVTVANAPEGPYTSLGVESLFDSDSLTRGSITTELDFVPTESQIAYFAIGLAPRIDPNGQVYIPQIFSPAATDIDNQTFRIFGERILPDNFRLEIFNRYGSLVYSTLSFEEANLVGWNGTNQRNGNEEPSGVFYYQVTLTRINGEIENYKGPFYLQR